MGDCWLIAAFACAAENPGLVMGTFLTKRLSMRGKYTVRLFDMTSNRWENVTVDESIPIKDGRPLFAQPKGREVWVAMLEKVPKAAHFSRSGKGGQLLVGMWRVVNVVIGAAALRLTSEEF